MAWNWQHKDWPQFIWNERALLRAETLFVEGAGVTIGAAKHISEAERTELFVELMSHEAVDTSAIEGEPLDRDSIQSSIRKHLGLSVVARRAKPAEAGIAELMVDLYREMGRPLTESILHRWHRLITNGRTDLADIGRYRQGKEPMQIVSGPYGRQKVHFEAPPASRLEMDMAQFWQWLDRTAPSGKAPCTSFASA